MNQLSRRAFGGIGLGLAGLGVLSACGSKDDGDGGQKSGDKAAVKIFASTLVWGSLASMVGGDQVEVYNAVSSPDQDPHDHEATAQDKLRASQSKLAIVNGGGYDDWAMTVIDSLDTKPEVIDAVKLDKHGSSDNEHVFYSLATAQAMVHELGEKLAALDADHADQFRKNAETTAKKLTDLQQRAKDWAGKNGQTKVVSTESVADYLIADLGMVDVTPEEYVQMSESESGPSAAVVEKTRKLIGTEAKLLVVNGQTEDAVSATLVKRAEQTRTRIVKVYETFPPGVKDYVTFISKAMDALTAQA